MKDSFIAIVNDNNDIVINNKAAEGVYLDKYKGKECLVEIRDNPKTRSLKQNAWYWSVAIPTIIAWQLEYEGIEYTNDEIHYYILKNIVKPETTVRAVMNEQIIIVKSKTTSQMSTKEFNVFKESLQLYFGERGIEIPDPIKL